ncbi:MAG: hypothetical protein Q9191_007752 [Dirinaria sp. TL-2023a]
MSQPSVENFRMEGLDPRNPAGKRPHDAGGAGPSGATLRKRRQRKKGAFQDVKDFVPPGGNFHVNADLLDDLGDDERGTHSPPPRPIGSTTGVKWNSGAKAIIRTSAQRKQVGALQENRLSERTLRRLKGSLNNMPKSAVDHPECQQLQQSIHKAEVDFNYSLYFPLDKEYQHLFPREVPQQQSFEGSRPLLWYFVEKCMVESKLEAFKNGLLDQELEKEGLVLGPRKEAPKASHKGTDNQIKAQVIPTDIKSPALEHQSSIPASIERLRNDSLSEQEQHPQVEHDEPRRSEFNQGFVVELSPDPQLKPQALDKLDENGDSVMLNLEINEPESGEISEEKPLSFTGDGAGDMESDSEQYAVDIRGEIDDTTEEDDAMIEYANADRAMDQPKPMSPHNRGPASLVELSKEDLDAQIRYFYTTSSSQDLNLEVLPVRCLVCAKTSHVAPQCPTLFCADCGAYNEHFLPFCPKKKKCQKCRGQGHHHSQCPSKLKLTASETECDLCHRTGHTEDICELLWRTSGLPMPLDNVSQQLRYLSCYECGRIGHLGNDCNTRRPGKKMGTSTWSFSGQAQHMSQSINLSKRGLSIKGKALPANQLAKASGHGLSIKGTATQRELKRMNLGSDEDGNSDGDGDFVRPKVPAPIRSGQIPCRLFTNPLRVIKASVQTPTTTGIAGQAIRITLEVPFALKAFPTAQVLEAGRIQITYLLRLAKSQSRRRLDTLFAQISGGMPVPIAQRFTIRCRALLKMLGYNTEYDEITRTTGANRCEM